MGLSIGKDKNETGKFAYELWIGFEAIEAVGGFETKAAAEQAGQIAQRIALFPSVKSDEPEMSIEEILAELESW